MTEGDLGRTSNDFVEIADAQYAMLEGLALGSGEAQERQRRAVRQSGLPLEVETRQAGIVLRLIPAGTFMMGGPLTEFGRYDDEVLHQVTLTKQFYCGKFEVTQDQWQRVAGDNPSKFRDVGGDAPVEQVNWDECQAFLTKLCQIEGAPEGTYRFLTEAEWEYACRAGTAAAFHYGDHLDSQAANFDGNYPYGAGCTGPYRATTVSVGSFRPNAWGLHDMHGNVWEWCQDWYGSYPSSSVSDPLGPHLGDRRVRRGGSWHGYGMCCRSARRRVLTPTLRYFNVGLRVARTTPS